mgnify:CR=1 FL=1
MGHILRAQLVGDEGLAAVKAVVAGEHVADAAAQRDELQPGPAEQLEAQQDGGDEGIGGTAEDGHEAHGGREPGGQAQQRVSAVRKILHRKSQGRAWPCSTAAVMMFMPAPL